MAHLRHEKLIAFKAIRERIALLERLPRLGMPTAKSVRHSIGMQHTIGVIPSERSISPDDFQPVNWRPLDVVHMHASDHTAGKFQSDLGNILHVDFQGRNLPIKRPERFYFTNKVAQIVQRMRQRENYAAAQVRARGIPQAIIFPGMPVWQILSPVDMDG